MKVTSLTRLGLFCIALFLVPVLQAEPLVVAVKESPPFSQQRDGAWTGLSVELWDRVAQSLDREYRFRRYEQVDDMLQAVEQGSADVAVGAISVTAERESRLDFTQPIHRGGLGIATRSEASGWWATLQALFSWKFVSAVLALALVLLFIGFLIWLFERRRNPEQFGGSTLEGIGSGFWWSAVTMTTVGYGDKAPVSLPGRLLGLVWMFASIITISGFTAAIASSVTVNQLQTQVSGAGDLPRVTVGSVAETSGSEWLASQGLNFKSYDGAQEAVDALANGQIEALVYDAPVLRHLVREKQIQKVVVLPELVREESYAFAVANGSFLREQLDQQLLTTLPGESWQRVVNRYLGSQ